MAGNPSAVVSIAGTVRSIERFDTKADQVTGEVRQAARVNVLTEPNGGFAEVYVGPEDLAVLDAVEVPGGSMCWWITCRAGNRSFVRKDETVSTFPQLWLRFVSVVDAAAVSEINTRRRVESVAS
jgi:hypothetical protein